MRFSAAFFLVSALVTFGFYDRPYFAAKLAQQQPASKQQSAFEKREAAYRLNNVGVALLEQYRAKEAIDSFTHALESESDLLIARINLAIALYYLPDPEAAKRQAEKALTQDSNSPQAHFILGLIARAQNRLDDAVAEFQKVLKADSDDVGTNANLGQIFVQQKKYAEAIAAFRKAVEAEPYNQTALYNLGLLLTRTGKKEEGKELIQKFQKFQATGAGTTIGTNYLEGGHYAEAVASTGAEAELVDRTIPDVKFPDVTESWLRASSGLNPKSKRAWRGEKNIPGIDAYARAEPIVLFDYNGDGKLDIFDASSPQRLLRNDGGKFTDVTAESGLEYRGDDFTYAAVAGDYDNDGKPDLFVVRGPETSFTLYHNDGNGHFSDRTKAASILAPPKASDPHLSCAFVDVDHDGDLDIFIGGPPNILLRNNGNGTFTDITQEAKVGGQKSFVSSAAIVPTDFDNRRDVDLFVLNRGENPPMLFRNMRDGTFTDVAKDVGLGQRDQYTCVAAGDLNKDGFTDFFLGRSSGPGIFAMSNGKRHFDLRSAPPESEGAIAAQFLDYDNDGLLDLMLVTRKGLRLWRNVGDSFVDVSSPTIPPTLQDLYAKIRPESLSYVAFASGDLDGDGDIDLALRGPNGELRILRNDGGNRNHSVRVDLHGRVSNRSAVEAKVELRAGSLYQKLETYSASPAPAPVDLIFGLGKRETPDAVRVLWPAGIVQAETEFPKPTQAHPGLISLNITELDRKPSSCPYLYTWNGERFEFVTDFMGGGEMGYLEEPAASEPRRVSEPRPVGVATGPRSRVKHPALPTGSKQSARYNEPDPDEYVRITADQLKERDGRYELRITDELEEALFVDRLQLLAITHPVGTEVFPNEGMSDPPKPFKLFITREARPPLSAVDDQGHDVLDLISHLDRRWPHDFKIDPIRGYAEEHSLTLKLDREAKVQSPRSRVQGPKSKVQSPKSKVVLLLTGWTDYAWSSDNVAAAQAGKTMKPPSLQVKDRAGKWRTIIKDIGIPVGRPQTVTVDLTGKFLSANREVRIVTNMRIYWDQILVATADGGDDSQIARLNPVSADLHWRGFSAEVTPDGREPFGYDYQTVSFSSPWKVMTGRYTREGDVRELLLQSDDMFAICQPGDELSVSFDATSLPSLPAGWTRTFLLYADGFSKEMDVNSASPDHLLPLPFHGMSRYPYHWPEHFPLDARHRQYLEKYNTRVVTAPVASIESLLVNR